MLGPGGRLPKTDNTEPIPDRFGGPASRGLITAAALVVVVAGLDAAGDVLLPVLFAVFLAIVVLPLMRGLQRVGVPDPVAIAVVVVVVAAVLVGVTALLATTVRGFTAQIPHYKEPLEQLVEQILAQLHSLGFAVPELREALDMFSPEAVLSLVGQTVNAVVAVLSRIVIVTVTMTFILFEANDLAQKTRLAFGEGGAAEISFGQAPMQVQRYLLIKSVVSAVTGILAGTVCYLIGLDFPLMWGLTAALLNFIPSIGSILAAIPPVMLAIVQLGPIAAAEVMVAYLLINLSLGNIIEPRLLGRTLGLSPLVVFLSLLFWGWLWGPAGMLFCVPLTVIAKLVLEGNEDTEWIAIFLGSGREVRDLARRKKHAQQAGKKAPQT
jgi:predicted PurR-regulated permease PerM